YLTALSTRLIRIWASRSRSALTGPRPGARWAASVTRPASAFGAMIASTESTTSSSRTPSSRSATRPSSMLERSVRSSSSRPSRSVWRKTISRKRRAFSRSSSAPPSRVSRGPWRAEAEHRARPLVDQEDRVVTVHREHALDHLVEDRGGLRLLLLEVLDLLAQPRRHRVERPAQRPDLVGGAHGRARGEVALA